MAIAYPLHHIGKICSNGALVVIVNEKNAISLKQLDINIDVVICENEPTRSLREAMCALFSLHFINTVRPQALLLCTADYLLSNNNNAITIIGVFDKVQPLVSGLIKTNKAIKVTIIDEEWRYYFITKSSFQKWFPIGKRLKIMSDTLY